MGLFALALALVIIPIATANTQIGVPVSNPMPASPTQQVVDGVGSTVNTAADSAESTSSSTTQSVAPSAQPSPLPSPSLANDPQVPSSLPLGETNGDVDPDTGDGSDITTRSTNTPTPSNSNPTSRASTASLAKCATCTPNLRAPGAVRGLAAGDAGSAADAVSQGERADAAEANVKDLTDDGSGAATPPAAVPGFGPVFALAGLGLLAWVRRRASG